MQRPICAAWSRQALLESRTSPQLGLLSSGVVIISLIVEIGQNRLSARQYSTLIRSVSLIAFLLRGIFSRLCSVILLDSLREMYSMSNIASSPVGMTRWSIQGPRNFSASFPTGVPPSTNPSFAYATDILVYRNNHQIFKYHLSSGAVESVPPLPGAASTRGPWRASTSDAHVLQCDGVLVCRTKKKNRTSLHFCVALTKTSPQECQC